MKKYSIVIISKNNRDRLIKTLEVLEKNLNQCNDVEKIVVEATDEELQSRFDINYIRIPLNEAGFANQRNIGIINSTGEFIIFIDDDVEVSKNWFKTITEEFDKVKDKYFGAMGAVFPKKENANFVSFCIGVLGHPAGGFNLHFRSNNKPVELSQVSTCNTIFKKNILLEVNMFNIENRYGCEDSDLCLRIIEKYGRNKFYYIPEAIIWHDTHRNLIKMIKWYIRRGLADIGLVFMNKLQINYVFRTSLLFKFLILYLVSLTNCFIFFCCCFLWYFFQLCKHRFMWKYFKIYNFSFLYRTFVFLIFPVVKFIADISFDIGRLAGIFLYLKQKTCK